MAAHPIPAEFEDALKVANLWKFFMDCTEAHQREYLKWIIEAKKPETRLKRVEQAVKMLAAKRKQEEG
jgi:uncharacterized protein YdeI (YjbR/CyaY-like superfamily)